MTLITEMSKNIISSILLVLYVLTSKSQNKDSVQYKVGFRFVPGIYLCLEDFKQNQPIEIFQIISNYDKEEAGFLRKVVSDGKLNF
jgi:hypothetical protein